MRRLKFLLRLIGSGLGTGYIPLAPGTFGSVVGLAFWLLLPPLSGWQQIVLVGAAFFAGVPICSQMEAEYGHDPRQATFDEVVGQWAALVLVPRTFGYFAASFLIFRALDIWKPFPAHRSQKLPGGWGIMADDLIVGVYTCLLLQIASVFFHR